MRSVSCRLLILCALFALARPVSGQTTQIIGRAISPEGDIFVSFDQPDPDYDIEGDVFGIRSRDMPDAPDCLTCPGLPASILDDTNRSVRPNRRDRVGLIRSTDFDPFFGVVDTVKELGDDWNSAVWTFDITGFTNLQISADMAAMGDFEVGGLAIHTKDQFEFAYSIDGAAFETLFTSAVDENDTQNYEMEVPDPETPIITLDDPLFMNSVMLTNVFQTLSSPVTGTGSQLELRFRAITDGSEEAFAFRNLLIEGVNDAGGGGGVEGDYNASGLVEQADLDLVLVNWGAPASPPPDGWSNDPPEGFIDQAELDRVLVNWGNSGGPGPVGNSVPAPPSVVIALLALGAAGARYKSSAPVMFVISARSFRRKTE